MPPWVATGMTSPPTELGGLVIKHGKLGQLGNPAGKVIANPKMAGISSHI